MIRMRFLDAADVVGGDAQGTDVGFRGVNLDSRRVRPGQLFVALTGMQHDGHDFVEAARRNGATAALVSRPLAVDLPQLVVPDTVQALGVLARAWRKQFQNSLIAVAGSNGKTTVKAMLGAIMRHGSRSRVLTAWGNLNNHIGVPLTLLRLGSRHRCAVVELGANHPGEITWLADIAQPTVALITNAGLDHLAGFGGAEGAARTNGEMLATMNTDGIAVLNADDSCYPIWREQLGGRRVVRFGLDASAEVQGQWRATGQGGRLEVTSPWGSFGVDLPLLGKHNGVNGLAAAAAALTLDVAPPIIAEALATMRPVKGRLQLRRGANGTRLIDDSYSANPSSLEVALAVLGGFAGEKVLVLGDMAELGENAVHWHIRAGEAARAAGIDRLYAIGELTPHAVRAFGRSARHFPKRRSLIAALRPHLDGRVTVLVKGSRCTGTERIVVALTENHRRAHGE